MNNPELMELERRAGIVFMGMRNDARIAMDAQPTAITAANGGIPVFLTTLVDPKLIEVAIAPMKAAQIAKEVKKGDWTTFTAMFNLVESTGEVSSYGDYNGNGRAGVNINFPQRQSYHYQTNAEWGERELEMQGLNKVDWVNRKNIAAALTLNKYQNKTYFFGVAGLQLYGLLNDPALPAAISPATKPSGGTSWNDARTTGAEVYEDIRLLITNLINKNKGLIDSESQMVLALSPYASLALTKTNIYNVNVLDQLKKNFPNLRIETAPEYSTASGELVQVFGELGDGQPTAETAFTEKLRSHALVVRESSWRQKKSQGSWGAIIYRPHCVSQMLGV